MLNTLSQAHKWNHHNELDYKENNMKRIIFFLHKPMRKRKSETKKYGQTNEAQTNKNESGKKPKVELIDERCF